MQIANCYLHDYIQSFVSDLQVSAFIIHEYGLYGRFQNGTFWFFQFESFNLQADNPGSGDALHRHPQFFENIVA